MDENYPSTSYRLSSNLLMLLLKVDEYFLNVGLTARVFVGRSIFLTCFINFWKLKHIFLKHLWELKVVFETLLKLFFKQNINNFYSKLFFLIKTKLIFILKLQP